MKKILSISVIILIMEIIFTSYFVQADSFRFGLSANKTTIKAGETVTLSLSVNDINAGELGINTVEGKLVYDEAVFEAVSNADVTSSNGWGLTYNDQQTAQKGMIFGSLLQTGTKENQEIGKIKLKAKANINVTETTIKITNIATNNGTQLISDTDKQIVLKIEKEENNSTQTNNDNTPTPTSTTNPTTTNNGANNAKVKTTQTSGKNGVKNTSSLPKAGVKSAIIIVLLIAVLISIVVFKKYKSIDK